MNERPQLLKQESGSGPRFRFEGKKVRKVGAQQVRMNSWLFPAAGATSGSGACHGQRPLGGPVDPKLPPLPVFVLKSCINEFFRFYFSHSQMPPEMQLHTTLFCLAQNDN